MTRRVSCAQARRELGRGVDRVSGPAARHLGSCDGCAAYAARFLAARESLREHRARVVPDASFAARVTAALPAGEARDDLMRWAALRLLPATVALTLVLAAWSWLATASPASLSEMAASVASDDVLAWVLENGS